MFKEITHNTLRKGEIKILHKFFQDEIDLDFLGAGLYATVYKFGPGKALRVEYSSFGAHSTYIRNVVLKQKSKYLPKVYFHGVYVDGESDVYITVMERLQKVPKKLGRSIERVYCQGVATPEDNKNIPTKYKKGINKVIRLGREVGLYMGDIHDQNIMVRKCGQLVITDPCN